MIWMFIARFEPELMTALFSPETQAHDNSDTLNNKTPWTRYNLAALEEFLSHGDLRADEEQQVNG